MLILNTQEGCLATKRGLKIKLPSYSSHVRDPQHLVALAGISDHIKLMILNSLTSSAIPVSQRIFFPQRVTYPDPREGNCGLQSLNIPMFSISQVELNECVQCEFNFINTGKFNFSFQAELSGPKALLQYLEFSPTDGTVDVGQSAHASLSFQPFKKCVLKGLELRIKVRPFNVVRH